MDSAVELGRLVPMVRPVAAVVPARQPDLLQAHRAQSDTTSEERAGLEFFPLPQLQVTQESQEALVEAAEQSQLRERQALPLLQVLAESDWPEVVAVEHTIHRPQTPGPQKVETGGPAIDSLAELWPHLQVLRASRAHLELVALELLQ